MTTGATTTTRHGVTLAADRSAEFCRRRGFRSLADFGPFLRDDFGDASDIDLLDERRPGTSLTLADLFSMQDELSARRGRRVDLVDRSAVEQSPNYIRRRYILRTTEALYAEG